MRVVHHSSAAGGSGFGTGAGFGRAGGAWLSFAGSGGGVAGAGRLGGSGLAEKRSNCEAGSGLRAGITLLRIRLKKDVFCDEDADGRAGRDAQRGPEIELTPDNPAACAGGFLGGGVAEAAGKPAV